MGRPRRDPAERFFEKIRKGTGDDCWEWLACIHRGGYGKFSVNGAHVYAHRWSYEFHVGPIPAGLQIDHLCRNRACVNPDHLEPVTNRENSLRGVGVSAVNAAKTECSNGHPFDEENTQYCRKTGRRFCRACDREKKARARALLTPEQLEERRAKARVAYLLKTTRERIEASS